MFKKETKAICLRRKQYTNVIVARSKILNFYPEEIWLHKTLFLAWSLPTTTNEDQILGFDPENHDFVFEHILSLSIYKYKENRGHVYIK
jgi:hypothetical protein